MRKLSFFAVLAVLAAARIHAAPVITLIGDPVVSMECGFPYFDAGATAFDANDGDISGAISTGGLPVGPLFPGQYIVTYNVFNSLDEPAEQVTRTINVADTEAPEITLNGEAYVTVECGGAYLDQGATAYDGCEGDISAFIGTFNNINTLVRGLYEFDYNVSDQSGHAAHQVQRLVEVVDTTGPEVTLIGDNLVTLECGDDYSDLGATAFDVCDGDLSPSIQLVGSVDVHSPREQDIEYHCTDSAGNESIAYRTVSVEDAQPPALFLEGESTITVGYGAPYVDPGATAFDYCDGVITSHIQVSSNVDVLTPGDYVVGFSVSDASGNFADPRTRFVTVVDQPSGTPVDGPDDFEPDNTPETAPLMPLNDASDASRPGYKHNFDVVGDVDWYKFNAVPGLELVIQTGGLFPEADTFLSLYRVLAPEEPTPDPVADECIESVVVLDDGTRLAPVACNDNADVSTLRSRIDFFTENGGLFYVRIMYSPNAVVAEIPSGAQTTYYVDNAYFGIVPGSIVVNAFNEANNAPVTNAIVRLSILNMAITANTSGVYSFGALPENTYTVTVEAPGFTTQQQIVTVSGGGLFALQFPLAAEAARVTGDYVDPPFKISLGELLRLIQFYNIGAFHCDANGEDHYAAGPGGHGCPDHSSDYNPHDWKIQLGELLRLIQFYNTGGYHPCLDGEDGFCAGP